MKRIIIICLFLLNPVNAYANHTKTILIYSENLKDIYIIQILNKENIQITPLDKQTIVKPVCTTSLLVTVDSLTTSRECFRDSLEENFQLSIDNYVELNLNAIDKDYSLSLTASDLHSFKSVESYFDELGSAIHVSLIWKFNDYMDTDLNVKELYDFYTIYNNDSLTTTYSYPFLIQTNKHWIPLAKTFYSNRL